VTCRQRLTSWCDGAPHSVQAIAAAAGQAVGDGADGILLSTPDQGEHQAVEGDILQESSSIIPATNAATF
jgi:photosystem II stability/assembly factor-like uncharacterized protein